MNDSFGAAYAKLEAKTLLMRDELLHTLKYKALVHYLIDKYDAEVQRYGSSALGSPHLLVFDLDVVVKTEKAISQEQVMEIGSKFGYYIRRVSNFENAFVFERDGKKMDVLFVTAEVMDVRKELMLKPHAYNDTVIGQQPYTGIEGITRLQFSPKSLVMTSSNTPLSVLLAIAYLRVCIPEMPRTFWTIGIPFVRSAMTKGRNVVPCQGQDPLWVEMINAVICFLNYAAGCYYTHVRTQKNKCLGEWTIRNGYLLFYPPTWEVPNGSTFGEDVKIQMQLFQNEWFVFGQSACYNHFISVKHLRCVAKHVQPFLADLWNDKQIGLIWSSSSCKNWLRNMFEIFDVGEDKRYSLPGVKYNAWVTRILTAFQNYMV